MVSTDGDIVIPGGGSGGETRSHPQGLLRKWLVQVIRIRKPLHQTGMLGIQSFHVPVSNFDTLSSALLSTAPAAFSTCAIAIRAIFGPHAPAT